MAANELKSATVSEEMAKKFATEKETPYTKWVKSEGLEIKSAIYQHDLHSIELKPWARRGVLGDSSTPQRRYRRLGRRSGADWPRPRGSAPTPSDCVAPPHARGAIAAVLEGLPVSPPSATTSPLADETCRPAALAPFECWPARGAPEARVCRMDPNTAGARTPVRLGCGTSHGYPQRSSLGSSRNLRAFTLECAHRHGTRSRHWKGGVRRRSGRVTPAIGAPRRPASPCGPPMSTRRRGAMGGDPRAQA